MDGRPPGNTGCCRLFSLPFLSPSASLPIPLPPQHPAPLPNKASSKRPVPPWPLASRAPHRESLARSRCPLQGQASSSQPFGLQATTPTHTGSRGLGWGSMGAGWVGEGDAFGGRERGRATMTLARMGRGQRGPDGTRSGQACPRMVLRLGPSSPDPLAIPLGRPECTTALGNWPQLRPGPASTLSPAALGCAPTRGHSLPSLGTPSLCPRAGGPRSGLGRTQDGRSPGASPLGTRDHPLAPGSVLSLPATAKRRPRLARSARWGEGGALHLAPKQPPI